MSLSLKIKQLLSRIRLDQKGAVTVDWIVLTSLLIGMVVLLFVQLDVLRADIVEFFENLDI